MMRLTSQFTIAIFCASAHLNNANGQRSQPSCSGVAATSLKRPGMVLKQIASLDLGDEASSTHALPSIAELSTGTFLVADGNSHLLKWEAKSGRVDVIATAPRGSSDWAVATAVAPFRQDTLIVFDHGGRRATLVSRDLTLRTAVVPTAAYAAAALSDGDVILNVAELSPELAGIPLVRWRFGSDSVLAFGTWNEAFRVDQLSRTRRLLAASRTGGVWTTRILSLDLQLMRLDGSNVSRWIVDTMSQHEAAVPGSIRATRAIREDSCGQVWTLERSRDTTKTTSPRDRTEDEVFDSWISVLDATSGRVLLSQRFDRVFFAFGADEVLARFETSSGRRILTLWSITVGEGNS